MMLVIVNSEFLLLFRFHSRQITAASAKLFCSMELETIGVILIRNQKLFFPRVSLA